MDYNNIPIYDTVLNEEGGVNVISLVQNPAMQSMYMAFSDDEQETIKLADEEERLILGAALIPNKLVLRKDKEGNPFFIRFSAETIKQTAYSFFRNNMGNNFNASHNKDIALEGVYVVGGFLKDSSIGMNPPEEFSDHPDGTWFVFAKVDDAEVWDKYIKTGELRGFSIEGNYGLSNSGEVSNLSLNEDEEIQALHDDIMGKLNRLINN